MTITASIIHCQVDQEPQTFHDSDVDGKTISFAVNLSFECVADSHGGPAADEQPAHDLTRDFLSRIRASSLVLYRKDSPLADGIFELRKLDEPIVVIADVEAITDPYEIDNWLAAQAPRPAATSHYWAPLATARDSETALEVDSAGAGHRLRAAQSWDAPVGHQFGLTRIIQIQRKLLSDLTLVVVPYYEGAEPQDVILAQLSPDNAPSIGGGVEPRITFDYDPTGDGILVTCRTAPIPMQIPPQTCEDFDPGLTPDGFLRINPDADGARRVTTWFEERATSLLAPHMALGPRDTTQGEIEKHERLFGIKSVAEGMLWDGAVWYMAARLISALDPFVIAVLKPGQEESEGEVLAPLVSLILTRPENANDDGPLAGIEMKPADVTAAIRNAFTAHSPLAKTDANNARLSLALEKVYGIAAPRTDAGKPLAISEDSDLVSELLWYFRGALSNGTLYVPPQPGQVLTQLHKDYAEANKDTFAQGVTRAAVALEQGLQGEVDAERAILRIVETVETPAQDSSNNWVGGKLAALIAAEYLKIIKSNDPALLKSVEAKIAAAWEEYRITLEGPFNGAEAVRRATGACLTKAALTDAALSGNHLPSALDIVTAVSSSQYFEERYFPTAAPQAALRAVQKSLARVDMIWLAEHAELAPHLADVFTGTVVEPVTALLDPPRFVPDQFPAPLPIQIAANIDGGQADAFARNFNGIAVAIRRLDTGTDHWAHAHLADLHWDWPNVAQPTPKATSALHTMLPAVSDGRGPMFIAYEGFPFADAVLKDRMADNGAAPLDPRAPFYTHEPHAPQTDPDTGKRLFAPTPRLAYGRRFETFGFVTSNAGSLPRALRESRPGGYPWMPRPGFTAPESSPGTPDSGIVSSVAYQRRTAIAEMSLGDDKGRLLGKSIEGVQPLAADYPRAVIVAAGGNPGVGDLLKERDGAGSIVVPGANPQQDRSTWIISDIRWTGAPKQLLLQLFSKPASPQDEPALAIPLDLSKQKPVEMSFALRIDRPDDGTAPKYFLDIEIDGAKAVPHEIPKALGEYCWLRLKLSAAGAAAAMSFAELERGTSALSGGPLLLLAPERSDVWKPDLPIAASVQVSTPRVSYLDFERWFANSDNHFPNDGKLLSALLVAYLMRHLNVEIGRLIDRLPDPAVHSVLVDFATTDGLSKATPSVDAKTISLAGLLEKIADKVPANVRWTEEALLQVLRPLDEAFRFRIDLPAGPFELTAPPQLKNGGVVTAKTPAGTVARLALSALVKQAHFQENGGHPSVFDEHLLHYSAWDESGGFAAFPSAAFRIEVMFNGLSKSQRPKAAKLASDMISARPARQARYYDLMTAAAVPPAYDIRDWRLLSEIDTTTQRWRPTGRPIYNWIDPRKLAGLAATQEAPDAALPLDLDPDGPLGQFEREAFLDRQDFDAHTVAQRLAPLPARTILQKHPWDSPTATYSRHRFTLRSRYAGALLKRDNREIDAWPESRDTIPGNWTHRVAMLADCSRILLTRPQLRALIPLTTAPGGESARLPAPPVAAILQEPPFARGGLADRIACEIKTGFHYGFGPDPAQVTIEDSRKEIGPTPYLTYTAFNEETAYGMTLIGEGPMGLTFDNVNASAPAFPNSMISLRPHNLLGPEPALEELFVGVAMRRYIDPAWATGTQRAGHRLQLDAEHTLWIELTMGDTPTEVSFGDPARKDSGNLQNPLPLLTCQLIDNGSKLEVTASVPAIDGVGAARKIAIARAEATQIDRLFLLHQPIAAGRYSASIMATPANVKTEDGRSNSPLTMASFEWSTPRPDTASAVGPKQDHSGTWLVVEGPHEAEARQTIASAPTFLKWTRTNRDFDFVHYVEIEKDEWVGEPEMARNLVGELQADHKAVSIKRDISQNPLWLCSSTFKSRFPSYVHRHIGLITSRYLKELGRPVEIFCRSAVSGDVSPVLVKQAGNGAKDDIYQPPEKAVRIVEFESPAAILCDRDRENFPDRFKAAYFDLVSTGFKPHASSGSIRLFLRFVGSPAKLRLLTSLTLRLWPAEKRTDDHTVPPDPTPYEHGPINLTPNGAGFAAGLFLTLRRTGAATNYVFEILRSNGKRELAKPGILGTLCPITDPNVGKPGLFLAIKATSSDDHEFWADVSLLHSPDGLAPEPFDFDWLFSPTSQSTAAESVSAAGLNQMVEAQARIIAVSPPIPIVKH